MLNLSLYSSDKIEIFFNLIKNRVFRARDSSFLSIEAKNYLTDKKIEEIIFSEPINLLGFHNEIIPLLFIGSDINNYNEYCKIKRKPIGDRIAAEIVVFDLYDNHITQLRNIFNYDEFIARHKITSYKLAEIVNQNTCTYCNRLYTVTVVVRDEVTQRINNSSRITRPTFDHWYSKSKHPILSLSFYNLIPSCSVCNSSVKGATEFSLTRHIHPYINEKNENFNFNYVFENVHKNNVILDFLPNSKIGRTLKEFKIQEIYNGHSEYELKDLLELRYKYSENYLDTLFNKTFKLEVGRNEAYRLIFGAEPEEKDFHKRPFSKFKKDILEKLNIKI